MKSRLVLLVALPVLLLIGGCATTSSGPSSAISINQPTVVEASCGQCKLGLKGDGCDLAVRLNGKSYFVDGVNLDSLGDAHAKDGMCNVIRRAQVTGEVKNGRFVATSFKLMKD